MSIEALIAHLAKPEWLPFFLVVQKGQEKMQFNLQRMIEAVIIGLSIAAVGYLTVVPRLEERQIATEERQIATISMIKEVKEQNLRHLQQGHMEQFRMLEQMKAIDARVIRLEKQRDGH